MKNLKCVLGEQHDMSFHCVVIFFKSAYSNDSIFLYIYYYDKICFSIVIIIIRVYLLLLTQFSILIFQTYVSHFKIKILVTFPNK